MPKPNLPTDWGIGTGLVVENMDFIVAQNDVRWWRKLKTQKICAFPAAMKGI